MDTYRQIDETAVEIARVREQGETARKRFELLANHRLERSVAFWKFACSDGVTGVFAFVVAVAALVAGTILIMFTYARLH